MAAATYSTIAIFFFSLSMVKVFVSAGELRPDFYCDSCPQVDSIVLDVVKKAMAKDQTLPAGLLRMHFHDCFIRGCDASVLMDSTSEQKAEKDGPPNVSLHGFEVIDEAKEAVEAQCPGTVSCADILALAARDAVALSWGPYWEVQTGRFDGNVSKYSDTLQIPAPTSNFQTLKNSYAVKGLEVPELVALSGAHTIGVARCPSFFNRLSGSGDPSMDRKLLKHLQTECPTNTTNRTVGLDDYSPRRFDNFYYVEILKNRSLLTSDKSLLDDPESKDLVQKFAHDQLEFFKAFANAMVKMSSIKGNGTVIRRDCRKGLPE